MYCVDCPQRADGTGHKYEIALMHKDLASFWSQERGVKKYRLLVKKDFAKYERTCRKDTIQKYLEDEYGQLGSRHG
jgi:hypothetical protein